MVIPEQRMFGINPTPIQQDPVDIDNYEPPNFYNETVDMVLDTEDHNEEICPPPGVDMEEYLQLQNGK